MPHPLPPSPPPPGAALVNRPSRHTARASEVLYSVIAHFHKDLSGGEGLTRNWSCSGKATFLYHRQRTSHIQLLSVNRKVTYPMFDFMLHHLSQIDQICRIIAALLAIAHWIRQLRKEKLGLTQEQFAELLDVAPRTVQHWERGDRKPWQEHMMQMQKLDRVELRAELRGISNLEATLSTYYDQSHD